jgi:class 3 adenylate cyclase
MAVCAVCGYEAPARFNFCPECGAATAAQSREQRKVVTIVFCDVVGSTALGESNDPEAVRALLARYFAQMKEIVERHGGTVEKFIGDAVMAVFGVPVAHEDDAVRACLAADEMRASLPKLRIDGRIGVTTGEVVTGTEERLATGDAVNVAARLQQAARPGEVLVGEPTVDLARAAVEVEALGPLELKGKARPVGVYRLLSVRATPQRGHQMPFVGRGQELAAIRDGWQRVLRERRCELFTIVGEAGVGKSRLVGEVLAAVEARVLQGRCLPYGEGITYWPVVEVIRQLGEMPSDPAAAASIQSLIGEAQHGTSAEEIAWAFRKLLEEAAPLVVVFDDIQWGEETFLDLIEHVPLLSSDAAVLLVCMARPDLVERRPAWPVALALEPLPDAAVEKLVGEAVPRESRERITRAAGGNPLFVTEMLAIAGGSDGEVVVPPTLRALLAARLDQLDPAERDVLERAAVEGEVFHRGAVQALDPEEPSVTPRLAALVRKQLIRPQRAQIAGEDGFRFRHLLIRDAAYGALTKSRRARLHERLADWLEQRGGLVELDELLGHHLEQATRYRAELGEADSALAERAGAHLALAGRRALERVDEGAAVSLLERSLELTRPLRLDVHLELDLASAYGPTNAEQAASLAETAAERARSAGDEAGEALARIVAVERRLWRADEGDVDELEALAVAALPLLEQAGDHVGLARVWNVLAFGVNAYRLRFEEMAHATEQAIRHAQLAGQPHSAVATSARTHLALALVLGPTPADDALHTLDAASIDSPRPPELLLRGVLLAMLGRFDEAWRLALEGNDRLRALRGAFEEFWLAEIAMLEGDDEAAERYLRRTCEEMQARELHGALSTMAPRLGRVLCPSARYDEAESLAQLGRRLVDETDLITQVEWRRTQALVDAAAGKYADAEQLARAAVAIAERTDALNDQAGALGDLAHVLSSAGRTAEALAVLEEALARYERKRNLAMAQRVRAKLADLPPAPAPVGEQAEGR